MPRPRIDPFWRERVRSLTETERLGQAAIARRLEQEGKQLKRNDYPSERSVRRIQQEFRALPEEDRRPYRELHWPKSFERGDLPWEAGRAALELLRHVHHYTRRRPTIGLARCFWRVSQAVGDAPIGARLFAAHRLYVWEVLAGAKVEMRREERYLAYAPWRSDEAAASFYASLEADPVPPFSVEEEIIPFDPSDFEDHPELLEAVVGHVLTDEERQAMLDRWNRKSLTHLETKEEP